MWSLTVAATLQSTAIGCLMCRTAGMLVPASSVGVADKKKD
jgi:hypothetical protein